MFKGETAENGKSQILDLLRGLLPPSAICSITASKLGDERYIVGLAGKLLNASDELSSSAAVVSEAFKTVITGNEISGRDVYRSRVEFRPVAQHVFAANVLPLFQGGMDSGVQRRLLVVPFNRVIPMEERIESIGQRIAEEEPDALLAWAVAGASRLIRQRNFAIPMSCMAALNEWLFSADPILAWVEHACDIRPEVNGFPSVATKAAHRAFREWAEAEGFKRDTLPAINGFTQRMKGVPGVRYDRTRTGRLLYGLVINSDTHR